MQSLAEASQRRLGKFNPQGLANLMWAFATLGHFPGDKMMDLWIGLPESFVVNLNRH